MKKLLLAIAVVAVIFYGVDGSKGIGQLAGSGAAPTESAGTSQTGTSDAARTVFDQRQSGTQITGEGVVSKLLADDTDGSRHQRFIIALASGQTLLVAHNIDLAPRIDSLRAGDAVAFNGVYEWNDKGGVIHWTHHDPDGRHEAGWLKHAGQIYQ